MCALNVINFSWQLLTEFFFRRKLVILQILLVAILGVCTVHRVHALARFSLELFLHETKKNTQPEKKDVNENGVAQVSGAHIGNNVMEYSAYAKTTDDNSKVEKRKRKNTRKGKNENHQQKPKLYYFVQREKLWVMHVMSNEILLDVFETPYLSLYALYFLYLGNCSRWQWRAAFEHLQAHTDTLTHTRAHIRQ